MIKIIKIIKIIKMIEIIEIIKIVKTAQYTLDSDSPFLFFIFDFMFSPVLSPYPRAFRARIISTAAVVPVVVVVTGGLLFLIISSFISARCWRSELEGSISLVLTAVRAVKK